MGWKFIIVILGILSIGFISAGFDISVFQGQYYIGTEFQQGTYNFTFDVYDDVSAGNLVYATSSDITTGTWGQWRVELSGISAVCDNSSKDYFMEITIDGNVQSPRRRLTHFQYIRKDIDETTTGDLTISSILNFLSGGFIQEFITKFVISKNLDVQGNLNVTGNIISGEKSICLEDGTNCPAGASSAHYVRFISTVDGTLALLDRYLPLGTDSVIVTSSNEASWVIDRNMTITGILWDSVSNTRTVGSTIVLMTGSNKASLIDTTLVKDIQGQVSGSDNSFNVSLAQGNSAAIKFVTGGSGGSITDLSVTFIGEYD